MSKDFKITVYYYVDILRQLTLLENILLFNVIDGFKLVSEFFDLVN